MRKMMFGDCKVARKVSKVGKVKIKFGCQRNLTVRLPTKMWTK